MYTRYSDAQQVALGKVKKGLKQLVKKQDADTVLELYRLFETSSIGEAAITCTEYVDEDLAEELRRHEKEHKAALGIREADAFLYLELTIAASFLFRWMKTHGYYGSTLKQAFLVLWDYEPIIYERLVIAIHDYEMFKVNENTLLTRGHWLQAIKLSLAERNIGTSLKVDIPARIVGEEFTRFYMRILLHLYHLIRYEKGIVQPVKSKHAEDGEVYLRRIEQLNAQINALREENDRMARKERKEIDSIVAPLERALRERDDQIETLTAENDLLRTIQSAIEQQVNDVPTELLELPQDGVMFIGGSPQLRTRIQAVYPAWKVLAPEDITRIGEIHSIVFLYTDYISHTVTNIVRKNMLSKPLYCHGTNWERLETSMRIAYTQSQREVTEVTE